jgi:hypothetical protein
MGDTEIFLKDLFIPDLNGKTSRESQTMISSRPQKNLTSDEIGIAPPLLMGPTLKNPRRWIDDENNPDNLSE